MRVGNNAGSGTWPSIICAVDWVTANAATIEVANMSLGGAGSEPTGAALEEAGNPTGSRAR